MSGPGSKGAIRHNGGLLVRPVFGILSTGSLFFTEDDFERATLSWKLAYAAEKHSAKTHCDGAAA